MAHCHCQDLGVCRLVLSISSGRVSSATLLLFIIATLCIAYPRATHRAPMPSFSSSRGRASQRLGDQPLSTSTAGANLNDVPSLMAPIGLKSWASRLLHENCG